LPLDSKFEGSNQAEDYEFLSATKDLNTTFFGGKVKPSAPFRGFVKHAEDPCGV
jgi:hypothetical protein